MSDTYDDLIRRLREEAQAQYEHDVREIPNSSHYLPLKQRTEWKGANAITALVKERDTALRDGERKGLERAAKEAESGWESAKAAARAIRALITQEQSDDDKV